MQATPKAHCRICRKGVLQEATREETFHPPGLPSVGVELLTANCDHCGKEAVLASQFEENLRRLDKRKTQYGKHLLGEEIFAFRRKYGLSRKAAATIFGKSVVTMSRYESEKSFPQASTRILLKVAMSHPAVLKELAEEAGVDIPLWDARCADRNTSPQG